MFRENFSELLNWRIKIYYTFFNKSDIFIYYSIHLTQFAVLSGIHNFLTLNVQVEMRHEDLELSYDVWYQGHSAIFYKPSCVPKHCCF